MGFVISKKEQAFIELISLGSFKSGTIGRNDWSFCDLVLHLNKELDAAPFVGMKHPTKK